MIALYIRVSTDEQAMHGYSIENQKERLEAYCKSQGWDEFRFYIDDGYTGTNTDRPALQRLIQHIQQKKIQAVIVHKLDRLGRNQKDVLHLLEDVFEKNGVTFKSATEPFDTGTPLGKAMLGILAVFAQLERDMIVERTKAGKAMRKSKGFWPGGKVPYGYRYSPDTSKLEIYPPEAEKIRKMVKMLLDGKSVYKIAQWVAEHEKSILPAITSVQRLLCKITLTGKLSLDGDYIYGLTEGIIDEETYLKVQKELSDRSRNVTHITGRYLLSNLLECGICGSTLIHHVSHAPSGKYHYYLCLQRRSGHPERKGEKCTLKHQPLHKLNEYITDRIKQYAFDLSIAEKEIAAYKEVDQPDQKPLMDELNHKLKDIANRLERWYDAFEDGKIDPSTVRDRVRGLEEEKRLVERQLLELEEVVHDDRTDEILEVIRTIGDTWDEMNEEQQKSILRKAICKIIIYNDREPEIIWNA